MHREEPEMRNSIVVVLFVAMLPGMSLADASPATGKTIQVNCSSTPQSHASMLFGPPHQLARALHNARPGDTIEVNGTCEEQVRVTFGPLTIDGGGEAVIDGSGMSAKGQFNGVITVDGAQGITLRGLTVRNGPDEGVLATAGANLLLDNVVLENNGTGLLLFDAGADIADSSFRENAIAGLRGMAGSRAALRGEIDSADNALYGAFFHDSTITVMGTHARFRDNGVVGIVLDDSSLVLPEDMPQATHNVLEATGNLDSGIFVATGRVVFSGVGAPHGSTLVRSAENGGPGIILVGGGLFANPFAAARVVLESNPVGMVVAENSSVMSKGGLEISGNFGPGLVADAAGTIDLSAESASFIDGNGGPDLVLEFGTRATIKDVSVGMLVCDPTALVRGTAACP